MTRTTSANADGVFEPFSPDELPWEDDSHGERFAIRFRSLTDFGGGSHVGVSLEELAPGKQACPAHYHMLEEEHVYVLAGELTVRLGEERYRLGPGDYVCFPAGQKVGHALLNDGDAPCRFLMIGERDPNEVVVYPDSGRVGVRLMGEGYRKSAKMEYWEGERRSFEPVG
jgi:uncharacterized cupin superfamily protein